MASEQSPPLRTDRRTRQAVGRRPVWLGIVLGCWTACGGSTAHPGGDDASAGDASTEAQPDGPVGDSCVPFCVTNACDVGDTCGGVCGCAPGVACVAGTCGGCLGRANTFCNSSGPVDGSTPGTCCGVGQECKPYGDANKCCGIAGQGGCVRDTDCCDFTARYARELWIGPRRELRKAAYPSA